MNGSLKKMVICGTSFLQQQQIMSLYPQVTGFMIQQQGGANSDVLFTAAEGNKVIKMWTEQTLYTYQEFAGFVEGDTIFSLERHLLVP